MPICIVGMHRSGTSMVAHLLQAGGLYLGEPDDLVPAGGSAADSLFEHQAFVALNEQILLQLGGAWDAPPAPLASWAESTDMAETRLKAGLLGTRLAERGAWGWKDPRNSLTLPLWLAVTPDLAIVHCLRHPLEVAVSLQRRHFLSYERGLDLWRAYAEQIVQATAGRRVLITHYDAVLASPREEIERIFAFVGLDPTTQALADARAVVSPERRHSAFSFQDLIEANAPKAVVDLYAALCDRARLPAGSVAEPDLHASMAGSEAANVAGVEADGQPLLLRHSAIEAVLLRNEVEQLRAAVVAGETGAAWQRDEIASRDALLAARDAGIASLRDDLASKERERLALEAQVSGHDARIEELEREAARVAADVPRLEAQIGRLRADIRRKDRMIADREESNTYLRGQVQQLQTRLNQVTGSRIWKLGSTYWQVSRGIKGVLKAGKSAASRPASGSGPAVSAPPASTPAPTTSALTSARPAAAMTAPAQAPIPQVDPIAPELLVTRPMAEETAAAVLADAQRVTEARYDIFCLSIIDWDFRFQRPQQIMAQFVRKGHRVFWVKPSSFLLGKDQPPFKAREIEPNLIEIELAATRPPEIYGEVIDPADCGLEPAIEAVRHAYGIEMAVAYCQLPSWGLVGERLRERWGWTLVYDCLDEWEGFPGIDRSVAAYERRLVHEADLVVVTAERLRQKWSPLAQRCILARNAVDFDRYVESCRPNALLDVEHPIIGYFGALADWLDLDLLEEVASEHPEWQFVLLGGVFEIDVSTLEALPNVHLLGQQPYELIPLYLYHFDVCIIPFKINEITNATDPVKLYEYLSVGKPVVATMMPEVQVYSDVVYLARGSTEFGHRIEEALADLNPESVERRISVAKQHTWTERWERIDAAIRSVTPRASIIIVTFGSVEHTKLCLTSVLANTDDPSYEVIVVDNGSSDGTIGYLRHISREHPQIKVILNGANFGFAAANNIGLAEATGDILILLNNDTLVPRGWLTRIRAYLADEKNGLVGPVSNFVGNEARVEVPYATYDELETWVREYTDAHTGKAFDIKMLAMFCLAMRRDVFEKIGPLDEQFGIGMFEDDDYAIRARQAGYRVVCAEGAFVHHFGQASFGKLIPTGDYQDLWDRNQRLFEQKWGTAWEAHQSRSEAQTSDADRDVGASGGEGSRAAPSPVATGHSTSARSERDRLS